jgi:hypothetical protein
MSIRSLLPHANLRREQLDLLEARLVEFYKAPPASYYEIADTAAARYNPEDQPFHCHLAGQVRPGNRVLEMGCGSAHLCPYVESRGGT